MWAKQKRQTGFTVVELLIVIVVIGILAAITIVAYNAVTSRANNAAALSNVDAFVKVLKLYKAEKGQFPPSASNTYSCLGTSDFKSSNGLPDGACYVSTAPGYSNTFYRDPALMAELQAYAKNLPNGELKPFVYDSGSNHAVSKGILYFSFTSGNTSSAMLLYYSLGNQSCGRGIKSYMGDTTPGLDITQCTVDVDA